MMKLPPPTKDDMLLEIDRELRMRAQVYPGLVFKRKLSQHQADRQVEVLKAIREVVERMP